MICLTASQVLAYRYCPRFLWFEDVLGIPQNQELRFKVRKGREVHRNKDEANRRYLRKRLGVVDKKRDLYLGKPDLPFRGIVDEVLVFPDGSMAPLDWKFAEYKKRVFATYRTQAVIYGYLIHHIFEVRVDRAFLVFTRSKNKLVTLAITPDHFEELETIHREMTAVLSGNWPRATRFKRRCHDCCYRNVCPK